MYHIRTTKTASGATAVQVVCYKNRKLIVVAHIASTHDPAQLKVAKISAQEQIERISKQKSLFPPIRQAVANPVFLEKCRYLGFGYQFIYEIFTQIFIRFKFHTLRSKLLIDLILMRILEPTSKLQSFKLLEEFFGIRHSRMIFYKCLPQMAALKDKAETKILAMARKELNFDFFLVFYDVTTLYFESSFQDEFRKPGFSKDNKPQQPQILVALVVTSEGFPVAYEIFEGDKFEGHTLIPVISAFKHKHKIGTLTVVADAAMISFDNIKSLAANRLHYIVGARKGSLPLSLIKEVSKKLNRTNEMSLRIQTSHGTLICDFSAKRFAKDKREMEKQIKEAEALLTEPAAIKRTKFLKNKGRTDFILNTKLIEKTKLLLGIKGYYTNLGPEINDDAVIGHYHNLWHVEQAFRIAKSDLQMRPMYHSKKQAIQVHALICFTALAVCKYIEIKTGKSIKHVVKLLKRVTDAKILDTLNNQEIIMRTEISEEIKQILSKLGVSY